MRNNSKWMKNRCCPYLIFYVAVKCFSVVVSSLRFAILAVPKNITSYYESVHLLQFKLSLTMS